MTENLGSTLKFAETLYQPWLQIIYTAIILCRCCEFIYIPFSEDMRPVLN